jgi:hypothetical protein
MPKPKPQTFTLNAVIEYARTLNLRADLAAARDPYADPYRPTEAAAKRVFYHHLAAIRDAESEQDEVTQRSEAAKLALNTIAGRARDKEREHQENELVSKRSLERHQRRQREAARDRDARRRGLTAGQRLDRALAQFSVIGSVGAAQIGWSTPGSEQPLPANHGDAGGEARYLALKVIREIEDLLDRHQRRDVSNAA